MLVRYILFFALILNVLSYYEPRISSSIQRRNPRDVLVNDNGGPPIKEENLNEVDDESDEEETQKDNEANEDSNSSDDFDDEIYEKCEYGEYEEAPIFADKKDNTHYIACAQYGLPVRLPCPPSTFFDPSLKSCVPSGFVDSLCGRSCVNGECVYDNASNKHVCKCYVGYTGRNCTEKINYCEMFGQNCGNGRCINQVGTYVCDCGYGLIGQSCDNPKPVPCQTMFVQEGGTKGRRVYHPFGINHTSYITCFSEDSFIVRKCKDGQFWNQDYLSCTNTRPEEVFGECENYPCLHGGKCIPDDITGYTCNCTPYHYGRNCEFSVDHCNPNPCNGHKCLSSPDPPGYICECPNKIYDDCCCHDIDNKCSESEQKFYAEKDNLFVHCTPDGRAFVKRCPENFIFDETKMTCVKPRKRFSKPRVRDRHEFSLRKKAMFANEAQPSSNELVWPPEASSLSNVAHNIPNDMKFELKANYAHHRKFQRDSETE